jgi:hypothetical protein
MAFLAALEQWWKSRQGRPLQELLAVDFDDKEIRVRVLAELEEGWNQTFHWSDITRVCFKDGGMLSSDIVYVTLRDREKLAQVPTAAKDGHKFLGALCQRGLFPDEIWRKAVGSSKR